MIKNMLSEKDGTWSWRKIMTACACAIFVTAVLGYLIVNKFDKLPPEYMFSIDGVFLFYFGKKTIDNMNKPKS